MCSKDEDKTFVTLYSSLLVNMPIKLSFSVFPNSSLYQRSQKQCVLPLQSGLRTTVNTSSFELLPVVRLLRYRAVWETLPFPDTVSTLHSVSQPTHCSQSVAGKLRLQAEMSVEDPGGRVCMSSRHSKKWPQAQSQTDRRRWSAKSVPVDQNKKIALPVGQQSFCFGLLHIWSFFSFKHQTVEFLFTDFNNWCQ